MKNKEGEVYCETLKVISQEEESKDLIVEDLKKC